MDILLRDLNPEDIEWIKKKTQNATSQNKFIKSLISEARIKEKLQLVRNSEKKNSYQDSNTPFSFIDLFAGIGGFRSALTFLGGKCVFTNEWNKYAITTYKNWYGDEESTNDDDIRNFNHSLIPSIHSFVHSFIHFTHSFIHSFHSFHFIQFHFISFHFISFNFI